MILFDTHCESLQFVGKSYAEPGTGGPDSEWWESGENEVGVCGVLHDAGDLASCFIYILYEKGREKCDLLCCSHCLL